MRSFRSITRPSLLTFVIGTNGITPDEEILGNPGHARKVQAICAWLNNKHGNGKLIAWAKRDPVRTEELIPDVVRNSFEGYASVFERYGKELYAVFAPTGEEAATMDALKAFLDLMFEERGYELAADGKDNGVRDEWQRHLLPDTPREDVVSLLRERRYVIVQGPPGTGKSRMAGDILAEDYGGNGATIQFHPNTTYESFVGGLAPRVSGGETGLSFVPTPGDLMKAVALANANPQRPYLLAIDEINRADIGKVLGEAIYLLEVRTERQREVGLPYAFDSGQTLSLPENLHILGTMNTSDRSLAIVDVAVRRRFSFVNLWPQIAVVQQYGGAIANEAFTKLLNIFIDHASGDAFNLVPGHAYFLTKDDAAMKRELNVTLVPLLQEYVSQGYVAGFGEEIRAYLQWIDSL